MGWFRNLFGASGKASIVQGTNSPAERGRPVKVILVGDQPLGKRNEDGIELHALQFTVYDGVPTPYQLTVGNPVPATALPLIYPGSKLNARLGDGPNAVIVVDWAAGAAI